MRTHFALLAWLAILPLASADTNAAAPRLFAYCVEVGAPEVKPRPLAAQAALLRELGYDGIGVELGLDADFEASLKALDDAGLPLHMAWTTVNVNPAKGPAFSPKLPEAIRRLKGRPVTVSVLLTGLPPGDPAGMDAAVAALRQLGDAAAGAGVRVSIYNHVGNWAESVPFSAEVVRKTDHARVGFNFNLCHWLKVDGGKDYAPLLRDHAAKLFCVTINGATKGASDWTNGLIRPLDEGDFDNRPLLRLLEEIGYRGPIGLMCYGVPGDAREHLARSMAAWRLLCARTGAPQASGVTPPAAAAPQMALPLPGEVFLVQGRPAFVILPEAKSAARPIPWAWYAPTLPGLPGDAEKWMFERFARAGVAVAGIDVGESYGSPAGRALYTALYAELTRNRGFASRPVMLARSRGGLMTLSWAADNADKVGGFAGIYPVCNVASYPGVAKACGAYGLTADELTKRLAEHNPVDRLAALARAGVPLFAIHGDSDAVVPLDANSGEVRKRYEALGGAMQLIVPPGQGHNMWAGFFQCQELVDFVIARAKGVKPATGSPPGGAPK